MNVNANRRVVSAGRVGVVTLCGAEDERQDSDVEDACSAAHDADTLDGNYSMVPILLVFFSQFVLGIGTTLYYALGQIYLDDNTRKTNTPLLLGKTWECYSVWNIFNLLSVSLFFPPLIVKLSFIGSNCLDWIVDL